MIKAIETEYNGYRFRSRLEARWAVFFDTLGIKYEYEKEGYDLDGTWYLPDFWLSEQECWIEIKGEIPTKEERSKAHKLAWRSGKDTFILVGDIRVPNWADQVLSDHFAYLVVGEDEDGSFFVHTDYPYVWCECPHCHRIDMQFEGRAARLCDCEEKIEGTDYGRGHNFDSPRLIAAYKAARSARFEHGEKP